MFWWLLCSYSMLIRINEMNDQLVALILIMIMFTLGNIWNITAVVAQLNRLTDNSALNNTTQISLKSDSDHKRIALKWLEANETKTENNPTMTSQDFWKFFGPLLELSANGTVDWLLIHGFRVVRCQSPGGDLPTYYYRLIYRHLTDIQRVLELELVK